MSKVQKEVIKGIDMINSSIAIFDDIKGIKNMGNVDAQKLRDERESAIDSNTIKVIYEFDALANLTDNEFRVFVRYLLSEVEKIKSKTL